MSPNPEEKSKPGKIIYYRNGRPARFTVDAKIGEMVENILEMRKTVVKEVMVPRVDMNAVDINKPFDVILEQIRNYENSRVPVIEKDIDHVAGILYVKDLMKFYPRRISKRQLIKILRKPFFVSEERLINDLLTEFKNKRIHLAVVTDEMGGTAGLVTLEDILEEIVGEIQDEFDEEDPLYEPVSRNRYRLDARMPIDDVQELTSVKLPDEDCETIGGLVFQLFGRLPKKGERTVYKKLTFRIESIRRNQIQKIIMEDRR